MLRRILGLDNFTGWHMAGVMALFFGVVISVNLTLAVFANRSWTGLVVENSYVASQNFEEERAAREAQAALGWEAALRHEAGRLTLTFRDREGRPLHGLDVTATVGRPTHESEDHTLVLAARGGGAYDAEADLAPGFWRAIVDVEAEDGTSWEETWRFRVERPR